jgi:PAS domain S-box-containing protein
MWPRGTWAAPEQVAPGRNSPVGPGNRGLPLAIPEAGPEEGASAAEWDRRLNVLFGELQQYVGWQPSDQAALQRAYPLLRGDFHEIVEDFYREISRHQATRRLLGESPQRPEILRRALGTWLDELFLGQHDEAFVRARWRVGRRHVEIGLPQVYTSAALSRLRQRLIEAIDRRCEPTEAMELRQTLNRVMDLDHLIIQEAYRHEWDRRQSAFEREQRQIEQQKTRQALDAVLKAAPCLIVIVDSAGIISDFSPFAETLTGYSSAEVVGRDWFEVFIPEPEVASLVRQELARALSTPFSTGYTNYIRLQDRPVALDLVARIQNAQDALHALYEEVRDYAAPIRLKTDQVNLRRVVEDTWENLAVERQRHPATLTIGACEGIPRCRVDALALERVFRNVLENALTCGSVPVKIEVELSCTVLQNRPAYRVTFRDNGPGISAEARARVFEPFFTTKTKGTGLGMAISRRLVEAHGGRIEVGEPSGSGAEIVITLPVEGPSGEFSCSQV